MTAYIRCRAPITGFEVWVECGNLDEARDLMTLLAAEGYRAVHAAHEWPRGPGGEPICLKHHMVMQERSKQNDVWHSHKILTRHGEERWCRGYRYGPEATDGFLLE